MAMVAANPLANGALHNRMHNHHGSQLRLQYQPHSSELPFLTQKSLRTRIFRNQFQAARRLPDPFCNLPLPSSEVTFSPRAYVKNPPDMSDLTTMSVNRTADLQLCLGLRPWPIFVLNCSPTAPRNCQCPKENR